jgi:hypothetical protein
LGFGIDYRICISINVQTLVAVPEPLSFREGKLLLGGGVVEGMVGNIEVSHFMLFYANYMGNKIDCDSKNTRRKVYELRINSRWRYLPSWEHISQYKKKEDQESSSLKQKIPAIH